MSRFNSPSQGTKTTNLAGGEAYRESPKLELVSILLTSFVADQYYQKASDSIKQLTGLLDRVPAKFAAQAAIYGRTKFGMRSISHVLAGELASRVKGEQWTKSFYDQVVYRPDDMTEIASYYFKKYGKPMPNSLKKGLAKAFAKFDQYQLAKYRGEGKDVSLVDLVNLVRPVPTTKNKAALKALVEGKLKSLETWEAKLTQAGQVAENDAEKDELKSKAWKDLLLEKKLGYFALLRNIRNIAEQSPEMLDEALKQLTDRKAIKKSLVLPFRFETAILEIHGSNIEGGRKILVALNQALDISVDNVPEFKGKTLIVLDTSGSMNGRPAQIGALFTAILAKANPNSDVMVFSNHAQYVTVNPLDSTLTIAGNIPFHGGGTNFHAIFDEANKAYDRIIILSDMQGWVGYNSPVQTFNQYKARLDANPRIYSFDLAGHGTLQFPEPNIFAIAGFSEKVFDMMALLEQDKNAMIKEIEKVEL